MVHMVLRLEFHIVLPHDVNPLPTGFSLSITTVDAAEIPNIQDGSLPELVVPGILSS